MVSSLGLRNKKYNKKMKSNYKPWLVKIDDFYKQISKADKIKFLLNFAVLAPSSHNSQPWRFEVNDKEIKIFLEPSRRLLYSDKNDRQAHISLGCAITNIITAADYYGFSCSVDYQNDKTSEYFAAKITFIESSSSVLPDKNHLIFFIPKRLTNRNKYENKLPPKSFLEEIKSFSVDDLQIFVIIDHEQKNQLSDIALSASISAMEDKNFRLELSKYIKPNTTSSPIGMPAFGMGIPTPISFIAPIMIKYLNMNKLSRKSDEALLKKHTPFFVIIAARCDDKISWIKTGKIYEHIALLSTRHGLSNAMWASPIQIGEYYKNFQKILNTDFRPQAFFRLGYASKFPHHSPRLSSLFLSRD